MCACVSFERALFCRQIKSKQQVPPTPLRILPSDSISLPLCQRLRLRHRSLFRFADVRNPPSPVSAVRALPESPRSAGSDVESPVGRLRSSFWLDGIRSIVFKEAEVRLLSADLICPACVTEGCLYTVVRKSARNRKYVCSP